jgi:predicted transposase/invertase (TIGR01784 family)
MEDILTDDIKLLIWQWIDFYKKIPEKTVEKIKQEVGMSYIATTITEHYQMQGRFEGKKEGKKEGIKEGIFKTARNMLKDSVPIETIKKYTGLGNEDIDRLNTIK